MNRLSEGLGTVVASLTYVLALCIGVLLGSVVLAALVVVLRAMFA